MSSNLTERAANAIRTNQCYMTTLGHSTKYLRAVRGLPPSDQRVMFVVVDFDEFMPQIRYDILFVHHQLVEISDEEFEAKFNDAVLRPRQFAKPSCNWIPD